MFYWLRKKWRIYNVDLNCYERNVYQHGRRVGRYWDNVLALISATCDFAYWTKLDLLAVEKNSLLFVYSIEFKFKAESGAVSDPHG